MKHEEQSQLTKQALSNELKSLMETKPLNKITIHELVEKCGVNRKTFYYHFEDIYALLRWTLEQEAIDVVDKYDLISEHSKAIDFALDYIEQNITMLRNIVHSVGSSEIRNFFYSDIYKPVYRLVCSVEERRRLHVSDSYKAFLSKFLTEAIAGILMDFIEREAPSDRESLSEYITSTLITSIPDSLESAERFGK